MGRVAALAALALYLGALGALYATWPGSPDQYELDYLGWRILEGDAPYVDLIDVNWPGTLWLHQLSVRIFGNTLYGWRVFDFGLMLLGLVPLAALLRRLAGGAAGFWAVLLYPPLYLSSSGPWFVGQPDIGAMPLVFLALWCHWRGWEGGRPRHLVGVGLALAAAMLVKPTLGILLLLLALHGAAFEGRRFPASRRFWLHALVPSLALCVGLAAALAMVLLQGATLRAVWEVVFVANLPAHRNAGVSAIELWQSAWQPHRVGWLWIAAAALVSLGWSLRAALRERAALAKPTLLPLVWLGGALSYAVQGAGYSYHLGPCYAAMVAMMLCGLGALTESLRSTPFVPRRLVVGGVLLLPLAGTALKLANAYRPSVAWLAGRLSARDYFASFPAGDGLHIDEALALVSRVERSVPEDAPVLVFGQASLVNFLSRRPQPTRFYYAPTLWDVTLPPALEARWAGWFRDDLTRRVPALCIVNREMLRRQRDARLPSLVFLEAFLAERFRPVERIGDVDVYVPAEREP